MHLSHVVVVIVAFANHADVLACVGALARSSHRDLEVLICENAGEAAAAHLRRELDDRSQDIPIRVIAADNPGFAAGVNLGILATPDADLWWILNPDTVPDPDALAALVARMHTGNADAVGGVVCFRDGSIQGAGGIWHGWLARAQSLRDVAGSDAPAQARAIEARQNYLLGTSMLVSRRFIDVAGLMREDYFLYAEEIEWCVRATARGLKLGHAPSSRIVHEHGTTTGAGGTIHSRPKLPIYLDERNKLLVVRDTAPRLLPGAIIASLGLILLRYGRAGARRQLGFALQGWAAALRNERGKPGFLQS